MLLGRLRIRGKLALLLIPPLLGMIALTVPVVVGRVQVAERASETAQTARLAGQVGSLIQELQQERLLSIGYLLQATARNRLVLQSAAVTDKIADLRASEPPLPDEVSAALDALPPLASVRAAVLIVPRQPDGRPEQVRRRGHPADQLAAADPQGRHDDLRGPADPRARRRPARRRGRERRRAIHPDHGGVERYPARHAVLSDLREPAQGRRRVPAVRDAGAARALRPGAEGVRRPHRCGVPHRLRQQSASDDQPARRAGAVPHRRVAHDARRVHREEDHRGRGRRRDPAAAARAHRGVRRRRPLPARPADRDAAQRRGGARRRPAADPPHPLGRPRRAGRRGRARQGRRRGDRLRGADPARSGRHQRPGRGR